MSPIEIITAELSNFQKQREQVVANVQSIEGAIQASQFLLGKLKAEAQKASMVELDAAKSDPRTIEVANQV